MKFKKRFITYPFLLLLISCMEGSCRPCDPTDPLGRNTGNLCPRFPYSSINDNTFVEGLGKPITTLPTTRHPAGIVIQKPSGFWTNVRSTQGQRSIQDSGGNTYILPNQNRMGKPAR